LESIHRAGLLWAEFGEKVLSTNCRRLTNWGKGNSSGDSCQKIVTKSGNIRYGFLLEENDERIGVSFQDYYAFEEGQIPAMHRTPLSKFLLLVTKAQ
jgi:hypothetical protein